MYIINIFVYVDTCIYTYMFFFSSSSSSNEETLSMTRPVVMSTDRVPIVALKYQFPLTEKIKQDSKLSWKK